jgi:branched-chain amino acid transport system permease protein
MPEVLRAFAMWRLVIYGLLFVVIMLFRPEGLFGNKEIAGELKRLWRWIKRVWARRTTGRKEAE